MKGFSKALVLALMCAAIGYFSMRGVHTQVPSCLTTTVSGAVQGLDRGASCAFLGVRFAAPPTGVFRWRAPQPAPAWAPELLRAMTPPPVCAQLNAANGQPLGIEDCLMLNIWTPNPLPAAGAPVIVWFHPGAFVNASANFAPQNGERLSALTGAIVVAPNYRLGPFGYLAHRALASEGGTPGNYGLLDQRAALAWIHDHIEAFGGDPVNVTIAGQSAGAHSVSLHLVSPGSAGLFRRAIMQSGYASFRMRSAADGEAQGDRFAAALGCTGPDSSALLACLRAIDRDRVLFAHPPNLFEQFSETGRTQWTPIVDGLEIPEQPRVLFEQGAFNRVPVLLGANRDEGWMFVNRSFPAGLTASQYGAAVDAEFGGDAAAILSEYPLADYDSPKDALARLVGDAEYACEARRVARLIERTKTPVFLYSFEYEVDPVVVDRVVHGLDVNFVFGNNFGPPLFPAYALGEADRVLSEMMAGYWARFAATGNPKADDPTVVSWPPFKHPTGEGRGSDNYLAFDVAVGVNQRLREARCNVWQPRFIRSITGDVPASIP